MNDFTKEELEEIWRHLEDPPKYLLDKIKSMIANYCENESFRTNDAWISVECKLPDLLQKVLFHWICTGGNRNISMGYLCKDGWDIYLPYSSFKMHPEMIKVTHWKELPEFPL